MTFRILIFCVSVCSLLWACTQQVITGSFDVIPLPQQLAEKAGKPFVFNKEVSIVYPEGDAGMKANAEFLAAFIQKTNAMSLPVSIDQTVNRGIFLEIDTAMSYPEGYRLKVDGQKIHISSKTAAGVFYGIQTLRKALPPVSFMDARIALPAVEIMDYPRFDYRGVLLDVGRHYFPVDYLKQFIDMMALHHINTFHWHLTEDQGWRIEIKKYPKLTEVGSRRKETVMDWETKKMDGKPYGGFYTQDEVREIVAYAAQRYINVIPEIDMPGHMLAALASYPELGCTGGPYEVETTFGVFADVLCAGNEQSLQFVKDVLTEVMELFPSSYIHIGGDECPKTRWKKCPKCQAVIRKNGIRTKPGHTAENQLQTWFMTQVEEFINSKGRRMIGWDEVLEGGLTPDATIMSWRGVQGGIKAAKAHHDVIITPYNYLYFSNPHFIKLQGLETVTRVYNFEPVPKVLQAEERHYIKGAQASIWTEWIKDSSRLEYVVLPRLAAASEIFWTLPEKKNTENFLNRLPRMLDLYTQEGYEFRRDIYDPCIQMKKLPSDSAEIVCRTFDGAPVFYTLDGKTPDQQSQLYTVPFRVPKGTEIKAVTVRNTILSEVNTVKY